ncbi:MAG: GSU2403 family nucleotidyltransferase fold protein [Pseudomonadota bacterium]
MDRHSPTAHSAYHDLRRLLLDDAASALRGTPTRVERGGRAYWYDTYRVGTDVRKRYLGEATTALNERLERHAALSEAREERRKQRTRLVRLLRSEGMASVDAGTGGLLNAMATAGVFRLGGTIVGTVAFQLYEGELGLRLGVDDAARTADLDIASFERLSLVLAEQEQADPPIETVLSEFRFEAVPSLERGKVWRWQQAKAEALVEFLTPSFEDDEGLRDLPALGVTAQSLHFLNFLIAAPIQVVALYRSGVLVQIPRPEAFAIHKLIVADRRREGADSLKAEKDRRQAALLIRVLAEDRPDELAEVLDDARERGPGWRRRLDSTLARLPKTAGILAALPS